MARLRAKRWRPMANTPLQESGAEPPGDDPAAPPILTEAAYAAIATNARRPFAEQL